MSWLQSKTCIKNAGLAILKNHNIHLTAFVSCNYFILVLICAQKIMQVKTGSKLDTFLKLAVIAWRLWDIYPPLASLLLQKDEINVNRWQLGSLPVLCLGLTENSRRDVGMQAFSYKCTSYTFSIVFWKFRYFSFWSWRILELFVSLISSVGLL